MTESNTFHRQGDVTFRADGAKITTMMPVASGMPGVSRYQQLKRVCAYARVSTDHEEQLTSYEAQVDYYTRYIQGRTDWEFAGIYTDEGITGTSTKHREGFKQMIADAKAGLFDLIITKSVSRFARNTVDSLITIRELKAIGVGVFFEKESIDTLDSKGELLLTIMSSLAQEESRSISENCTWGVRKRFADGKVSVAYSHFLGYDKGDHGRLVINEEEAKVVRRIYRLFLEGNTPSGIARLLTGEGFPTPAGKKNWTGSTVESILTNEKYKGDAVLQKSFTTDFLTKKSKINEGEVPKYYVKDSHPAIITREQHDLVQYELHRRRENKIKQSGRTKNGRLCFTSRIICGDCGGYFGSKVWHSNSKYRRVIWQCNHKYNGTEKCATPHVTEQQLEDAFLAVIHEMAEDMDTILAEYQSIILELTDTTAMEKQLDTLSLQARGINARIQELISQNTRVVQDQDAFTREYQALEAQYNDIEREMQSLKDEQQARNGRRSALKRSLKAWGNAQKSVLAFDDDLFTALVDQVTVFADGRIVFTYMDGTQR